MSTDALRLPRRLSLGTVLLWSLALQATLWSTWDSWNPAFLVNALQINENSTYNSIVFYYSTAPRIAMAVLIGCGLGLAGAVLQQLLNNPLASPTTLGVESGAQLALGIATLYVPSLLVLSSDMTAIAGGMAAAGLVLAFTWRLGVSPVTVILAGLVTSFFLGALNAALLLFNGEFLGNLFIWGAGSLVQNDWSTFESLYPRVLLTAGALLLLLKPLRLLQLGEASARSLGVSVGLIRVVALLLVVIMTAAVVSEVGVIGFVGLAAPVLARLLGARTLGQRLLWSTVLGGAFLLLADNLAQWATYWAGGRLVPTGTATALLGGPLILLALKGLRNDRHMPGQDSQPTSVHTRRRPIAPIALTLTVCLGGMVILAMSWVPSLDGWAWTPITQWGEVWQWRAPRLVAAMVAGVALGLAGTIIQRLTRNVMASPEILGVSGGAGLAMVGLTLFGLQLGRGGQLIAGTIGAALALLFLLQLTRRHRFGGHQLLLGGLALYIFMDAGLRLVLASGGTEAIKLLTWMAGSTWLVTTPEAGWLFASVVFLGLLTAGSARPLALLAQGDNVAQAAGLQVARSRTALLVLAALLTATATLVIGPLSFVGLMAPHLARMLGQQTVGRQMVASALTGAVILGGADYLSRIVMFPYQLPAGLVAALLGGLYFVWSLTRNARTR